jgi:hypothetical protein
MPGIYCTPQIPLVYKPREGEARKKWHGVVNINPQVAIVDEYQSAGEALHLEKSINQVFHCIETNPTRCLFTASVKCFSRALRNGTDERHETKRGNNAVTRTLASCTIYFRVLLALRYC